MGTLVFMGNNGLEREYQLLTSPAMGGLLQNVVTGQPGAEVPDFNFELEKLHNRPGADVTASYLVTYRKDHPDGSGDEVTEHLYVTTADVQGAVSKLSYQDMALRVWRHPYDPRLPALVASCDPRTVTRWLADSGVAVPRGERAYIDLIAYRPLRRAVVRATVGGSDFYLKVLRPHRFASLSKRQAIVAAAQLTPPVLSEPTPGVIITTKARGMSLTQVLANSSRNPAVLPPPGSLVRLLDRLPQSVMALRRRDSWSERADFHGAAARAALPDQAGSIRVMVAEIQQILSLAPLGYAVPTHGDFYEANIFVENGQATQMIDLDALGPGHREDDLACVLAHMTVLPDLSQAHYPRLVEVTEAWRSEFEQRVHPAALRIRVAGVLLSLVAGTTRSHALTRLDLARAWLYRARQALGN